MRAFGGGSRLDTKVRELLEVAVHKEVLDIVESIDVIKELGVDNLGVPGLLAAPL